MRSEHEAGVTVALKYFSSILGFDSFPLKPSSNTSSGSAIFFVFSVTSSSSALLKRMVGLGPLMGDVVLEASEEMGEPEEQRQ